MGTGFSVSIRIIQRILFALRSRGVNVDALLPRLGLEPGVLQNVDGRVPYELAVRLWELAEEVTGDELFGFHLGQTSQTGGVLDLIARHAATLGESLAVLDRYYRLLFDGARLLIREVDGQACVIHQVRTGVAPPRHPVELLMSSMVANERRNTGVDWKPLAVHFRHPPPLDSTPMRRFFGCPVRFSQPVSQMLLDPSVLSLPNLRADPELETVLKSHAELLIASVPVPTSLSEEVRRLLLATVTYATPELPRIAKKLQMSARSLQRRLNEEGTTFQALLDEARRECAARMVQDPGNALVEVAFALGYSELSAFDRAFRRWTGRSPSEYRRICRGAGGAGEGVA